MKIGLVPATPFFLMYGGGEAQLMHPYRILKQRGHDIHLINLFEKDIKFDILHFFGLHYTHYRFIRMAKSAGIKVVLEPISYATKKQIRGALFHRINKYFKIPTTQHLHREIILLSDHLVFNSYAEKDYLEKYFNVKIENYSVAYNAISEDFFKDAGEEFFHKYNLKDYVLCVGKIEPRKHQLELARLMKNTNYKMVFIGAPVLDALSYFKEFMQEVENSENIYHFEPFEQNSNLFKSAYICSKIHILLGDNETPGMTSLEAAVAGKNIVVHDCKPVREYFGDNAFYCNNEDGRSVINAIENALSENTFSEFSNECSEKYSWENAANVFERIYKEIYY